MQSPIKITFKRARTVIAPIESPALTAEVTPEEDPVAPEVTSPSEVTAPAAMPASDAFIPTEEMVPTCKPFAMHSLPSQKKLQERIRLFPEIPIVEALGVMHVLTPELLCRARSYCYQGQTDLVRSAMETMESRGFLCSYEVDGERLYCCSPMLAACIEKGDRYQILNEMVHRFTDNPRRDWRKPVLLRPTLVAKEALPLAILRRYRALSGLVSDLFVNSGDSEPNRVIWDADAHCHRLFFMSNAANVLTVLPLEEYLAAPADRAEPLLSTADALPDPVLMASCPPDSRYFFCGHSYVWNGTAWVVYPENTESEAISVPETTPAAVSPVTESVSTESESAPAVQEPIIEPVIDPEAALAVQEPIIEPAIDSEAAPVVQEPIVEPAIDSEAAPVVQEPIVEPAIDSEAVLAEPEFITAPVIEAAPVEPEPAISMVAAVVPSLVAEELSAHLPLPTTAEILLPDGTLNQEALNRIIVAPDAASDELLASIVTGLLRQPCTGETGAQHIVTNALLLAASAATCKNYALNQNLAQQLQMATGLMAEKTPYTSLCLNEAFPDNSAANPPLLLAAYAQALFTPAEAHDHWLLSQARFMLGDYSDLFPDLPEFKALFNHLLEVQEVSKHGFTPSVIAQLGSNAESEAYTQQLRKRARHLMDPALTTAPTNTRGRQAGIVAVYEALFQTGSDLYVCMDVIAENRTADFDFVDSVLREYCLEAEDGHTMDSDAIHYRIDALYREKRWSLDAPSLYHEIEIKAYNQVVSRLEVMKEWLEHVDSMQQHART